MKENDVKMLISDDDEIKPGVVSTTVTHSMEFDGDIIITDPAYVIKDEDWGRSGYGTNMDVLGINTFISRSTLYGDWVCTVFDEESKGLIGEFCADTGMVSVMSLEEAIRYNPEFNYHTEKPWTTTLIKDFKGTVGFVEVFARGIVPKDSEYRKAGDIWEDTSVEVIGRGMNKKTGANIKFRGFQTGL